MQNYIVRKASKEQLHKHSCVLPCFFEFQFYAITVYVCYCLSIPPSLPKSAPRHLSIGPGSILIHHFNLLGQSFEHMYSAALQKWDRECRAAQVQFS